MSGIRRIRINRKAIEENVAGYLFILPALLFMVIFLIHPTIQLFAYSFTNMSLHTFDISKVGLTNYTDLLDDRVFIQSFNNSLYFTIIVVPVQTAVSLLLAVLLTKISVRVSALLRTVYFFPVIASLAAISMVWKLIFQPDFGLANAILQALGFSRQEFLGDPNTAFYYIMFASVWKNFGWYMLIFISGILAISPDILESGKIDGTSAWTEFYYITLPMLRRQMLLTLVLTTMDSIKVFAPVYIMTSGSGGPLNRTNVAINYIYNTAFKHGQLGYAAAASTVVFLVILVISAAQFSFFKERD